MLAVPRYFRRGKCPVLQMLDKFVELWFRAVGVDAHIDPPQNGNTSRVGTDGRYRIGFRFRAVGADDPVRPPENALFHGKPMQNRNIFNRPMWASAPTTDNARFHDFMGGQSRPPLQMTVKNRTGHAKTAAFPVSRCRGRCPHRPARNGRFMAAFRRNRVDFLFYAVGADDPVRPPENARFYGNPMRIRNIFNGPM